MRTTKRSARKSHPHRPYVLVNMAMTADGKIATSNRAVSTFGSRVDQLHLLELRAQADAVMCGAGTANQEQVTLLPGPARFRALRRRRGLREFNLRVVVTGTGGLRPDAEIFRHRESPIIVVAGVAASEPRLKRLREQANEVLVCGRREVDLPAALRWLRAQWGVRTLLCEGGGELNAAMFREGLIDEVHLTICPVVFGGRAAPSIADGAGFPSLPKAARLKLQSSRRIGNELFLVFRIHK